METVPSPDELIASVARELLGGDALDRMEEESARQIAALEPAYGEAGIGVGDIQRATRNTLTLSLCRLAGVPALSSSASAPLRIGQLRAEQEVPLTAVQNAFRLDFRVLWEAIVDRARDARLSDQAALVDGCIHVWNVVEVIAEEVAVSYRERQRELQHASAGSRELAFIELAERGEHDRATVARCSRALGLPEWGTFVALHGSLPVEGGAALRRLVSTLAYQGTAGCVVGPVGSFRGVLDASSFSPAGLREVLAALRLGRVGVAEFRGGLDGLARGLRLAAAVVESGEPAETGLFFLSDRWIPVLMHSASEISDAFLLDILGPVLDQPEEIRGQLLETLAAYVECDGSINAIAARYFLHRNTVRKRLDRVEALVGRSLSAPTGMAEVVMALRWLQEAGHVPQTGAADVAYPIVSGG